MTMSTSGNVGGDSIDFSAVSMGRFRGVAVEPKVCEMCGENFWRPKPQLAQLGQRECPRCARRAAEVRAERMEQPAPTKRRVA
jgi:hypothetical protein